MVTCVSFGHLCALWSTFSVPTFFPLFRREEIESVEDLRYLSVDDFVAIGLERNEAQDLSRMCATVAV